MKFYISHFLFNYTKISTSNQKHNYLHCHLTKIRYLFLSKVLYKLNKQKKKRPKKSVPQSISRHLTTLVPRPSLTNFWPFRACDFAAANGGAERAVHGRHARCTGRRLRLLQASETSRSAGHFPRLPQLARPERRQHREARRSRPAHRQHQGIYIYKEF